jgi:hypothetical protein
MEGLVSYGRQTKPAARPYPSDDTFCSGFDVPDREAWGPVEVAFWTSTPTYQPWKDVAAYFNEPPA